MLSSKSLLLALAAVATASPVVRREDNTTPVAGDNFVLAFGYVDPDTPRLSSGIVTNLVSNGTDGEYVLSGEAHKYTGTRAVLSKVENGALSFKLDDGSVARLVVPVVTEKGAHVPLKAVVGECDDEEKDENWSQYLYDDVNNLYRLKYEGQDSGDFYGCKEIVNGEEAIVLTYAQFSHPDYQPPVGCSYSALSMGFGEEYFEEE
ncbi:hypothetical protein Q7P37_006275 [Cladosporium fusiforme]